MRARVPVLLAIETCCGLGSLEAGNALEHGRNGGLMNRSRKAMRGGAERLELLLGERRNRNLQIFALVACERHMEVVIDDRHALICQLDIKFDIISAIIGRSQEGEQSIFGNHCCACTAASTMAYAFSDRF